MSGEALQSLEARKVEIVRSLCQGPGITERVLVERADDLELLLDGVEPDSRWDVLTGAFQLMPESPFTDALLNALFAQDGNPNLTDRRNNFLKEKGNVTYRTLIRHEHEGAELYVKYLEIAKRFIDKVSAEDDALDEEDPDVAVLRERVTALEEAVKRNGQAGANSGEKTVTPQLAEHIERNIERYNRNIEDLWHRVENLQKIAETHGKWLRDNSESLVKLQEDYNDLKSRYEMTEGVLRQQGILLDVSKAFKPST